MKLNFISKIEAIPRPANRNRALMELDSLVSRALKSDNESIRFMAKMAEYPSGKALLLGIFGNSQFLSQLIRQEPEIFYSIDQNGFKKSASHILNSINGQKIWGLNTKQVAEKLRIAKRRFALLVALADITNTWDLEKITLALSDFADLAVECSLAHLLNQAYEEGKLTQLNHDNPTKNCGITILGMGKLGAQELNYSSDIDLIVLFEKEKVNWVSSDTIQQGLHRLTRDLVNLLSNRTKDGYVFRTDLRLRPDAGATPLAISTSAAERYYESLGQNWERAALIKARPIAGDKNVGFTILKSLEPFIWRKNLDFSAIEDIHSIKRQIYTHRGHRKIAVFGHNIKLGRGGIREIELYAQTQQLIWGGRDSTLRSQSTCSSLDNLASSGKTKNESAKELIAAYSFLRHVEHRLQMVADEQTHTIPSSNEGLRHIATFCGFKTSKDFVKILTNHLVIVERNYAELFEDAPDLGEVSGNLVFTGTEDDPNTIDTLERMGFTDGSAVASTIRGWHHGRVRATRSNRARELLTELMPKLLGSLAETVDPNAAFFYFNNFMTNLPSGVQLFSLFHANPHLLLLVAEVMGSAPRLAEELSRHPELLDGLLTGDFYSPLPIKTIMSKSLNKELINKPNYEDILNISRRWAHEIQFQIGMQLLQRIIDGNKAGIALSNLAEVIIETLLPLVESKFSEEYGEIYGANIAVLAMGKLGARELTFLSDLDLIFIYEAKFGLDKESSGPKKLAVSQYFNRLANRFVSALSSLTSEGRLYDVDTRLRPSGNAGPIASEINGFHHYQTTKSWTWEHMALTRARVIATNQPFNKKLTEIVNSILRSKRDIAKLTEDVSAMRIRVNAERGTKNSWKLQHVRGGLIDIQFITQFLQLQHAHECPRILSTDTREALNQLSKEGYLDTKKADELKDATYFFQNIQALLRLTVGMNRDPEKYPEALRNKLTSQRLDTPDFASLESKLIKLQKIVYEKYYVNFIERPLSKTHIER